MSGKNDRIIVFGMIALGVLAMAGVVAVLGIGAYVYNADRPTPTPVPTAAPTVVPATATPIPDLTHTFNVRKVFSDEAERTYTLLIELEPGAAPVDMSRLTVRVVADGKEYAVWDYFHDEHAWAGGNGDVVLGPGETFELTVWLPRADVPLADDGRPMQIILLFDGRLAKTINAPAV